MRIILFTGKGGVGKTSIAAATAVRAADMGYKTIVMSTDIAHSLADSFDHPLGPDPTPIAPNLWGQEIDVLKELERYWSTVRDWLTALLQWQGVDEVVAEEIAIFPGMDELVGLLYITRHAQAGACDVLVVDCAPTGETMRLLSFPDMARWYMRRLFPIGKRTAQTLGPLARVTLGLPVPGEPVFASIESLYQQLEAMQALLTDHQQASVRLVVNAEKMVVKETQRSFTYLNLYGYNVDMVVCNRLIPPDVTDPYFQTWRSSQAKYFQMIQEAFSPVPIFTVPLFSREVVGIEALREMARVLYGDKNPIHIFHLGNPQEIRREGEDHLLLLKLPFAARGDIALLQSSVEELVVQVGSYRRTVFLPRMLVGLGVKDATLEGDTLRIRFQGRASAHAPQATKGPHPHTRKEGT
ncbi:MAG: TRC40/GET3/ArsA family transport-energizing ATPase [Dehalococcoidia bacterium]|nr:TRC40/GET3/ArsA family transport-energizing ATPase [Dehalococcoidia bacterium]MDW8120549.1 TRC40/GET3/ArsA family transport-energizing ATPase [Chloroflexota bacterium]